MSEKELLRKELKKARNKLSDSFIETNSELIFLNIKTVLNHLNFNSIAVYKSFNSEVSTDITIDYLLDKNKNVCLPKIKNTNDMQFKKINSFTKMQLNKYGILEPKNGNNINQDEIDIFIVPCVGFNKDLYRIGMGKGYYDKFLSKNGAQKLIGIAFQDQLANEAFQEKHDIKMDFIITEKSILS